MYLLKKGFGTYLQFILYVLVKLDPTWGAFSNKGFGIYLQLILYVVCECFRFNGNGNPADYETSYIILDTANKGFGTYL